MTDPDTQSPPRKPPRASRLLRTLLFGFVLPVVVIGGGLFVAKQLVATGPKAKRQPPAKLARLVAVEPVRLSDETVWLESTATVGPARQVTLQASVTGEVIGVSPRLLPGGRVAEGEVLFTVDPTDYELALAQRKGELARAESKLQLERGQQAVARQDLRLLGDEAPAQSRALALREPQLASAKAELAIARVAVKKAELDLARTRVSAPFGALVLEHQADLGTRVTSASSLATLVATDSYWLEVSLPQDQLHWLKLPEGDQPGSRVKVSHAAAWGAGVYREGELLRLAGDLEAKGRLARLIVAVPDPLAMRPENAGLPPLLLGGFVSVAIEGRGIDKVAALAPERIRDGDRVWLLDDEDQLAIRPVTIAFRGRDRVLVSEGLAPGEQVVVTNLSAPVAGMPLRVRGEGRQQ